MMRGSIAWIAVAAVLTWIVYLAATFPTPPMILTAVAAVLAAGIAAGARLTISFAGTPHWRGSAASGAPGWTELRRELDRSRRAGHEFALLRIAPPATNGRTRWTQGGIAPGMVDAARDLLRSSDTLWMDGGALYALLPETDGDDARAALDRLRSALSLDAMRLSVASFPESGWTSEVLLARLHGYASTGAAFAEADELGRRQRIAQAARADQEQEQRTATRTRRRRADEKAG